MSNTITMNRFVTLAETTATITKNLSRAGWKLNMETDFKAMDDVEIRKAIRLLQLSQRRLDEVINAVDPSHHRMARFG